MAANPTYTGTEADAPIVISWLFAVVIIYMVSTVGSIFGGWLPKKLINGGIARAAGGLLAHYKALEKSRSAAASCS